MTQPKEEKKKKAGTPSNAGDVGLSGEELLSDKNKSKSPSGSGFFGLLRSISNRKYSILFAAGLITAGVFTGGGALVLAAVVGGAVLLGPSVVRGLRNMYSKRQERLTQEAVNPEAKKEPTRSEKMNKVSKWGATTVLGVAAGVGAALLLGLATGGIGFLVVGAVAGTVLAARAIQISRAKLQEQNSPVKLERSVTPRSDGSANLPSKQPVTSSQEAVRKQKIREESKRQFEARQTRFNKWIDDKGLRKEYDALKAEHDDKVADADGFRNVPYDPKLHKIMEDFENSERKGSSHSVMAEYPAVERSKVNEVEHDPNLPYTHKL